MKFVFSLLGALFVLSIVLPMSKEQKITFVMINFTKTGLK